MESALRIPVGYLAPTGDGRDPGPGGITYDEVNAGLVKVVPEARTCGCEHEAPAGTTVAVRLTISGKSGTVSEAIPQGTHRRLGECVASVAKGATFRTFDQSTAAVEFRFVMPGGKEETVSLDEYEKKLTAIQESNQAKNDRLPPFTVVERQRGHVTYANGYQATGDQGVVAVWRGTPEKRENLLYAWRPGSSPLDEHGTLNGYLIEFGESGTCAAGTYAAGKRIGLWKEWDHCNWNWKNASGEPHRMMTYDESHPDGRAATAQDEAAWIEDQKRAAAEACIDEKLKLWPDQQCGDEVRGLKDACGGGEEDRVCRLSGLLDAGRNTVPLEQRSEAPRRLCKSKVQDIVTGAACWQATVNPTAGLAVDHTKPEERHRLYERACEAGNLRACLDLGIALGYGKQGVPRDPPRAMQLFDKACDGGLHGACTELKKLQDRQGK